MENKYKSLVSVVREMNANRNTEIRKKVPNVGRPDTASDPTDSKSTLYKQGQIQTKIIDEAEMSSAHKMAKDMVKGWRGYHKAELHSDGTATVHTRHGRPDPYTGKRSYSSANAVDNTLKHHGFDFNHSEKEYDNHTQSKNGHTIHVTSTRTGHAIHIKPNNVKEEVEIEEATKYGRIWVGSTDGRNYAVHGQSHDGKVNRLHGGMGQLSAKVKAAQIAKKHGLSDTSSGNTGSGWHYGPSSLHKEEVEIEEAKDDLDDKKKKPPVDKKNDNDADDKKSSDKKDASDKAADKNKSEPKKDSESDESHMDDPKAVKGGKTDVDLDPKTDDTVNNDTEETGKSNKARAKANKDIGQKGIKEAANLKGHETTDYEGQHYTVGPDGQPIARKKTITAINSVVKGGHADKIKEGTQMFSSDKNHGVSDSMLEAAKQIMEKGLVGKQKKLDKNHNGKLDAQDFKMLRKEENEQVDEGNANLIRKMNKLKPTAVAHGFDYPTQDPKTADRKHLKRFHKDMKKFIDKEVHKPIKTEEVELSAEELSRIEEIAKGLE